MERKGFGGRWRRWIRGCLRSYCFAVIVNGKPVSWFDASMGLRQGDPLSPFLFTIVVDVLSSLFTRGIDRDFIEGLSVGREQISVSHLQFVDDTILFLSPDLDMFRNVLSILKVFELISGLKINLSKSCISGINLNPPTFHSLVSLAGCDLKELPISYLGLSLGANSRHRSFWDPVLEKVGKRLDVWKRAFFFSLGVTIVQSCLSSIPRYYSSIFKAPKDVVIGQ